MDRVLRNAQKGQLNYLENVTGDRRLAETVLSTVDAVRLAGLNAGDLDVQAFEVRTKSEDLAFIATEYAKALAGEQLVDYASILSLALDVVANKPDCMGANTIVLVPDDLRTTELERQLLEALPANRRHVLRTDMAANASTDKTAKSNLDRLRWLRTPAEAPKPLNDGSVRIVRAIGEMNEVRAVVRRCLAEKLPFDHVELLHTDADTYVPLVYECLLAVGTIDSDEDLPVTFAEGIPVRYSRPGRALSTWLSWMHGDYPQATLVKAIREGLLEIPDNENERSGLSRLATIFRGIGIGLGRDRYLSKIDEHIETLKTQLEASLATGDEEDEGETRNAAWLRIELRDMQGIRELVKRLLGDSPVDPTAKEMLVAAIHFIETQARRANKFDQFAATRLLEEIRGLENWISDDDGEAGIDIRQWLSDLPAQLSVMGSGPCPGKLHVDHVRSGGHSSRPVTFIVGLDDTRFPGTGSQDPVLLDTERRKLSSTLPTATGRLEENIEDFAKSLARLRGQVTLSFSCHDVADDREMFPSPLLLAAYRVLSGQHGADQSDLLAALDVPVSFAPVNPDDCLTPGEWWQWRLCGPETVENAVDLVQHHFPHLEQGALASRERLSDRFTSYDGRVPAAGKRLDPTSDEGRVVSANALQTAGKCPLQFFYKYGLGLQLPDELTVDSTRWLDPLAFGLLLHELFEQFMRELLKKNQQPEFHRDRDRLEELLVERIAHYENLYPPQSKSAFQSQTRDLRLAAATFLREEERFCRNTNSYPAYLEASLGLPADGHGTPLDSDTPIPIKLPNGKEIRTRGRIDRIDRVGVGAVETYAIWDYKSGSTYGYDRADPFRQGRLMQPLLYVSIVGHRLREAVSPKAKVTTFGFFFPGVKAAGQRVSWSAEELTAGMTVLEQLCEVIHHGAFLPTNDHESDCKFCDYAAICGDVATVAEASQRKLDNTKNRLLKPLKELRSDG
jgi:ATP-dependent helicase/nuclease subunit B